MENQLSENRINKRLLSSIVAFFILGINGNASFSNDLGIYDDDDSDAFNDEPESFCDDPELFDNLLDLFIWPLNILKQLIYTSGYIKSTVIQIIAN
jgi:hypothetical protein